MVPTLFVLLASAPAAAFSPASRLLIPAPIVLEPRQLSTGRSLDAGLRAAAADNAVDADADADPTAELRRNAERLRREAEEMEEQMSERRKERRDAAAAAAAESSKARAYSSLPGSAWTVSYRFSSDPPPKDDERDKDGGDGDVNSDSPKPRFYSGRVDVLFRDDGYTTILNDDRVEGGIQYTKFWGWDEELSTLDNKKYLLFSADVSLPEDDPYAMSTNADSERIYFNARVDKDLRTGEVTLGDGKVTVKRDVEPPGGFWGFFSGQGILAQFRYVGDFVCRPIALEEEEQ